MRTPGPRVFAPIVAVMIATLTTLPAFAQDQEATALAQSTTHNIEIRWTSYGIPHVKADDWGGLGYGFAYATLTDGICVFAREIATANGTLSADLGESDEHYASDVFHRAILTEDRVWKFVDAMSRHSEIFHHGFVAGYNRFLADHEGNLPASCAGESWVRRIEIPDLGRMLIAFGIRYGLGRFKEGIAAAAPPGETVAAVSIPIERSLGIGSNAIALGKDLTDSGRGMLFGNPHYPWHGPARFHMIHATIPGVVDSMGASLLAGSFIAIGFNKDIAWTHTVSTAARFTLYELEVNPDNPMQYRYGNGWKDIEARSVQVTIRKEDGSTVIKEHTAYMTHYGPLLISDQMPWTETKAYAMRDAILNNDAAMATYEALQTATSVDDVEAAISKQGLFFVNTIAADRHGNAFYADISSTPNIDEEMLEKCRRKVQGLPSFILVLNGADPACEWKVDPRSAVTGNLPAADMPRIKRSDFLTNSNDSYWLSNPDHPLEGYLPTIGPERTARSLRTRAGLVFLNEQLQKDGKLSPDEVRQLLYSHRHFGAELLLDDVLKICADAGTGIAASCEVLRDWDRTGNIGSRGTHLWTVFWERARKIPDLYAVPFDVDDPVNTPRGIAVRNPDVRDALRDALADAQKKIEDAGIDLDARWGDVQFARRNGSRIPIPGAPGRHGMFSYIVSNFSGSEGFTPIIAGNSYIQIISWDEDGGLHARGMLTYSQSPESDSAHYSDLTELYSRGEWIDLPFTEEEIRADPDYRSIRLQGEW